MDQVFDKKSLRKSEYPSDFIPAGAELFIGFDRGSDDGDYTVKVFYDPKTGETHIQEFGPNIR